MTGKELGYIKEAHANNMLAGDGPFTRKCHEWLEQKIDCYKALLTHSCTAALEMAAMIANIQPGDEIIMPSYTFVSTANAFVLRGAIPVFVDVREDTLNLNEKLIEDAITSKTKAIVPVHYAGVGCEMNEIIKIAKDHKLWVFEDAAQGAMATYNSMPLGSLGDLGCLSFHETKNIICGEGGALLVNKSELAQRAEIIREKGTNRSEFFRGETDKYTWVEVGSSYLPGEISSAFLYAQLQEAEKITKERLRVWDTYHNELEVIEMKKRIRRPIIPKECKHNGHLYYILLKDFQDRQNFIAKLAEYGINSVFHYVPLHSSPAGRKFGRYDNELPVTESISERIVRLPLWVGIGRYQDEVIKKIKKILNIN
jgi:dTDP-4-amino-4,6-dideoxygalactose transaminase